MKKVSIFTLTISLAFLLVLTISIAQEGDSFTSDEYRLSFIIPEGLNVYTPDDPGPVGALFVNPRIKMVLAPPGTTETNVNLLILDYASESEMEQLKAILENGELPIGMDYTKIHVEDTTVGSEVEERAIDHMLEIPIDENNSLKMRQIIFMHNSKSITMTFTSPSRDYDEASEDFFKPLIDSIDCW